MTTSPLKLFLVRRPKVASYGEFQAFVVAASDEDEARSTDPAEGNPGLSGAWPAGDPEIIVREIGFAHESVEAGVVIADYVEE